MAEFAKQLNVVIDTGNILCINEIKMNAGQNTTEELVSSLKYAVRSKCPLSEESKREVEANISFYPKLKLDIKEERKDVKISVKIFVRLYDGDLVRKAVLAAFTSLNTAVIDSVVLALRADNPLPLETIQNAWTVLEEFVPSKKVLSIGVSDIDTDVFIALYEWAKVKPGIVQINLAHCCVVPPPLQSYTREHDVQLLTHSDPIDILPDSVLAAAIEELDVPIAKRLVGQTFQWATRYQIHIKCRGVLASKGYIIGLTKQ